MAAEWQTQLHEDLYRANFNLASIHLRNREHSKAIRCWEAARECARRMRDKYMESECYCSIGQAQLSLGDLSAGKRLLKKSFLLGSQRQSDRDSVRQSLKRAIKGCRLEEALSELTEGDQQGALSVYEQLGDLYCKVGCYTKAAEHYRMQLRCAESLCRPDREIAVIHVSLAATYSDLKDYKQAVSHYRAELGLRKGNPQEECKTWLNMALAMEEDGLGFGEVQSCLSSALKCAQETEDSRLQGKVLRQLLALQRKWGAGGIGDTEAELREVCGATDDESSEEELENSEALLESDLELSQSEDEEDLEGYAKSVPGKRRVNQWNRRNEKGETVLHRACIEGNVKLVQSLLDKGHPLNPRDYCGWTPLHEACNHGHLGIVQLLLGSGANINDAGGPMCEGITPLHDALSSGNFDVAQLLIKRGASVTQRNAKGAAPLGSLQEWSQMYGKHLDQETRRTCKETEKLLRDALAGKVASALQPTADLQDSDLFDAEGSQPPGAAPLRSSRKEREISQHQKDKVGPKRSASLPRNLRGASEEEEDHFALHQSPPFRASTQIGREGSVHDELPEQLLTPLKPVKKRPRLRVSRSPSDSAAAVTEASDPHSALVPHTRLGEGGMEAYQKAIHGLGSAKSRLLTQSLAQQESVCDDTVPRAALVPSEEYLGDDWLEDDLKEDSRLRKRGRMSPTDFDSEEVEESEDELSEELWRERPAPRPVTLSRKRSRQTKLTQIVDRAVVGRTKSGGQSNAGVPRVMERALNNTIDCGRAPVSALPQTPPMAINTSLPPPIRVRVRVQDNIFLIPIPHSDTDTRDVSWLADQASQRYYQSCGLLPRLTLKKEGALLAPQDLILHVLQSNEEVLAEVTSWDLPPLTDRYRKACQSLDVAENRLVLRALEQQEMNPCMSLCRLALKPPELCPLIRALKLQSSLRQLHLSGNLLRDLQVEELLWMLGTMPNLTHLNLSCNRLTHEGIKKLLPAPGTPNNEALQNLEELDLSMNPLGDGLSQPLASLLHHCPVLSVVHLQACQLSTKFVQQHRLLLAEAFRGAIHLKTLSLSHNPLGSTGVELLLKTLPHETISRLDLRSVNAGDSLIMEPLVRYLSQDGCILSHLALSSNNLSDESVRELARCLPVCSSLTALDLSGNPKVGTNGLECLLNGIWERNCEMAELNLTGCSIQGPLNSASMDVVSSLLRELRLGSHSFSKKDRETLTQAWPADSVVLCRQHRLFLKRLT
ncbi:tonsoku-like protein [Pseudophryne corroboree]|uniref:tonsoku-like protein n=1 Tax=Pseudophryne corroboree TaxID=495146 RepID=UPI0030818706